MWITLGVVATLIIVGVIWIYNRLVSRKQLVDEGWSGVDVQLKRRADLIPRLVDVVKGYAAHEKQLFKEVTRLRTQAVQDESINARGSSESALGLGLSRLLAVAEAYPELKASDNFLKLQNQLAEVEDHIQKSRRYYNGTVRNMNIAVRSFPSNLVAGIFGFTQAEFFELADPREADAPEVQL